MVTNASFSPGAGLASIARGLSRTSGTHVCNDVLKVSAILCGLVLVAVFLLATTAMTASTGSF